MTGNARRLFSGYRASACRAYITLLLISSAWSLFSGAAIASPAPPSINAYFLEDVNSPLSASEALDRLRQDEGAAFPDARFNQANADSHYWLHLRVANNSSEAQHFLVDTGVPFRRALTVYLLRSSEADMGSAKIILETGDTEHFGDRLSAVNTLHSKGFELAAGENVELLLDYSTRGATYMPLTLKPPSTFAAEQQQELLWAALFYATCTVIIMMVFMFGIAIKAPVVLMYASLFLSGLLLTAANEGYGYQYLWPNAPLWNQYAGLLIMLFTTGLSFLVARYAMDPSVLTPLRARILLILAALSFSLALACSVLPFSPLIDAAGLLTLLSFIAQVVTIASWLRVAVKRNLLSLASSLIILPCVAVILVLSITGFDFPDFVFDHLARVIFLFVLVSTLAAQIVHTMALRVDHENSLEASLLAARREAEMNLALLESEQNYVRAKDLAHQRKQQLASTSHDIRQPLTSLRAILDRRTATMEPAEQDTLRKSLEYIEELSRPVDDQDDSLDQAATSSSDTVEPYRADLLLETLVRMFEAEAVGRSIGLSMVPCSVKLAQSPLVIMRILTNLTANAIKHCPSGRVLLGCRRGEESLRFEVIDTGPGMTREELDRVRKPYEKGEHSQGEGLGLAICWQLAQENGLELSVRSRPEHGTRFSLRVHLAIPSSSSA